MPSNMDRQKIEDVLAFALCVASDNDGEWDAHQLGPIHLLKYLYLADVLHAEKTGAGLTGVEWQFYNFGPWNAAAHELIEPMMRRLGADVRYDSRYRLVDPERCDEAQRRLPASVWPGLRRLVRDHGGSTESLLEHVYMTAPMRHARPNGRIDLATTDPSDELQGTDEQQAPTVSTRQARQRAERISQERVRITSLARANARTRPGMVRVQPSEAAARLLREGGQEWIDGLAGEPVPDVKEGRLVIDDTIWDIPRGKPLP